MPDFNTVLIVVLLLIVLYYLNKDGRLKHFHTLFDGTSVCPVPPSPTPTTVDTTVPASDKTTPVVTTAGNTATVTAVPPSATPTVVSTTVPASATTTPVVVSTGAAAKERMSTIASVFNSRR